MTGLNMAEHALLIAATKARQMWEDQGIDARWSSGLPVFVCGLCDVFCRLGVDTGPLCG